MFKMALISALLVAPAALIGANSPPNEAKAPVSMTRVAFLVDGGRKGRDPGPARLAKIFRDMCYPAGGAECCAKAREQCEIQGGTSQFRYCKSLEENCVTGGFISGD